MNENGGGHMYGCEILFTEERGRKMMTMVERVTGQPCPCKTGKTCPLLPLPKVRSEVA